MARRKARYSMKAKAPVPEKVMRRLGVDARGRVQAFVTGEVARRLPAYMPRKSGALQGSVRVSGPKEVKASAPYARAQFFGVTKSGAPFNYDVAANPKAGPHWDRRLMAEQGESIARAARKLVKRKGYGA